MVEVLRAHDLFALSTLSSFDPDEWLARDCDVECPVYLVVYPPHDYVRYCRWAIAWPVGPLASTVTTHPVPGSVSVTAWRHVQLEALADPLGAEVEMHFGYFGALTKTASPEFVGARRYELGTTTLTGRREIERLARETPVLEEEEGWNCQDWVRGLLERMVGAGIVSAAQCNQAVSQATN